MRKQLFVCLCITAALVFGGCQKKTQTTAQGAAETAVQQVVDIPVPVLPSGVLSTGPHGEQASSAQSLSLSDAEIAKIKSGNYKVAIAFHYAGNDWSTAQQAGLRDQFGKMGITVLSVTDANFKAEQQISDIENAIAMKPDAIVSIPVDVVSSRSVFKKA
ncbi:MAG: substrate-binding domain-containing protein, partial [Spirochaetaceae bacterium]|nr:substrate-binding domain-containing protein [Spirochaetaceae bacterium]